MLGNLLESIDTVLSSSIAKESPEGYLTTEAEKPDESNLDFNISVLEDQPSAGTSTKLVQHKTSSASMIPDNEKRKGIALTSTSI